MVSLAFPTHVFGSQWRRSQCKAMSHTQRFGDVNTRLNKNGNVVGMDGCTKWLRGHSVHNTERYAVSHFDLD